MDTATSTFKEKLFDVFVPSSYRRMYIQTVGSLVVIVALFVWSNNSLRKQLSKNILTGVITDIQIGTVGGNLSGKYRGKSTHYRFKFKGYASYFRLTDASVFENWQVSADDFKKGDTARFQIMTRDEQRLQTSVGNSASSSQRWASSIKMYGLSINGKTLLSTGSSIRGQTYQRWFWVMIPLFIYALFCLYVRTQFRYWTPAANEKSLQKTIASFNMDIYQKAEQHIGRIENELKKLGEWQQIAPSPNVFTNMGAFGSNTMPFTMWLQFVFIPNVKDIISNRGNFPKSSSIATYAYRNLEDDRYQQLNALLSEFDALFNR